MTKHQVEFEGKTYWPIHTQSCNNCEHFGSQTSCAAFRDEVRRQHDYPVVVVCVAGSKNNRDIIWQSTDDARLQYITERLTS